MKLKITIYAYDYAIGRDGAVDPGFIHASTYGGNADDAVVLGAAEVEFDLPPPEVILQSKIVGMEKALEDYRAESQATITRMLDQINELKALPAPEAA